jgi:hypothetical protein
MMQALPLGVVHEVTNETPIPATSIHVYSPPLTTMTHYDPSTLASSFKEHIIPGPAEFSDADGSALLHPSSRKLTNA